MVCYNNFLGVTLFAIGASAFGSIQSRTISARSEVPNSWIPCPVASCVPAEPGCYYDPDPGYDSDGCQLQCVTVCDVSVDLSPSYDWIVHKTFNGCECKQKSYVDGAFSHTGCGAGPYENLLEDLGKAKGLAWCEVDQNTCDLSIASSKDLCDPGNAYGLDTSYNSNDFIWDSALDGRGICASLFGDFMVERVCEDGSRWIQHSTNPLLVRLTSGSTNLKPPCPVASCVPPRDSCTYDQNPPLDMDGCPMQCQEICEWLPESALDNRGGCAFIMDDYYNSESGRFLRSCSDGTEWEMMVVETPSYVERYVKRVN